jgi:hypothetical protein
MDCEILHFLQDRGGEEGEESLMKTWENVSRGHGTSFVLVLGPFKITGGPLELQA